MGAVAVLNVLAVGGNEAVVVIEKLVTGEELLLVTVAEMFVAVRERVIEVEVITGLRGLGV